jgi:fructose transport system permease protein
MAAGKTAAIFIKSATRLIWQVSAENGNARTRSFARLNKTLWRITRRLPVNAVTKNMTQRRSGILDVFRGSPIMGPLAALILACVFFTTQTDRFLTGANFSLILQQVMVVGTLAIGQTLVILTGGIDLSNGMVMALSSVLMTGLFANQGMDPVVAFLLGMLVAVVFGLINGALITSIRLPPFIVTLGSWNIIMAACLIYSANETLREADVTAATSWLHFFGTSFKIGSAAVTLGVLLMLAIYAVLWYVLNYTAWGRHLYAVGDDPDAAQLSGIRVDRVLLATYGLAGVIAAIAAWVSIGRNGSISPSTVVTDYNLQAITAAVIGGISLFGGRGSILGTLFGAVIVGVMSMGLNMMNADPQWKVLLTGALIIGAVAVDQWIRKVSG